MKKIVFATHNSGKLTELQALLADAPFEIVTPAELGIEDVPETGLTFVENALIKARNAASLSGLAAIADDSGLAVDVLNGAPGIYSARYAGDKATSSANIAKLLDAMKNIKPAARQCTYHCVLVYLRTADDPTPIICQGIWRGMLLTAPQGEEGFGYDPLFFVDSHHCSAAELPLTIKNTLSHRGQALRQLMTTLTQSN